MFAAMVGKPEIVSYLLNKGADSKPTDERGISALSLAEQQDSDKVVAILKSHLK